MITIDFEEEKVSQIVVEGKVMGIYLEPTNDTTRTRTNARPGQTRTPARPPARPAPVPGVRRP
jgi:hypothetical protein